MQQADAATNQKLKNLQEELSKEINDLNQPFIPSAVPMTGSGSNENGGVGSPSGLSVDAVAAASQRATKKLEKNLENIKKKVIPEAIKTAENSLEKKMT